jgi:tyramine---L-glutamate ligase
MMRIFVYEHLCALGAGDAGQASLAPSLLREGRAMLDAVSADLRSVPGVEVVTAASAGEPDFRRHAADADFSLVIAPEFDGILEERCRWTVKSGGRLLGPSPALVRLTADKLDLCHYFQRRHVPTPRTWPLGEEPSHFPVVWKPRDGAGSQATFLLWSPDDRDEAEKHVRLERSGAAMVAQEFIGGAPSSVAFLAGPSQRTALQPCSQLLSSDGRFQYRGGHTPLSIDLTARAVSLATVAVDALNGLHGYVGVDLVLGADPSADRIIEVNPRLTTSYIGLRQLADFNIAEMLLRAVRGETLPALAWRPGSVEFTLDRATYCCDLRR